MAENLCSSLALAFTRQEKLNTDALNFLANNGNYTLARRQEGIELLANLISLCNTFEEIDEKWEGIVKSIVDAAEKADAQALYELHAFGIGDPNVIPYRLVMGDIADIIGEVECEVFFITVDLKGTTRANLADRNVVFASIRKECNRAIVVASALEKASELNGEQLPCHDVLVHDVKLDEKVTVPTVESSFIHIENPNEILLDYKIELERSSKVDNLGKFFSKIKVGERKTLSKKRHFFKAKFSETFVEKLKKFFEVNQVFDFKSDLFTVIVQKAIKAFILLNYKKKRKCQSKAHIFLLSDNFQNNSLN